MKWLQNNLLGTLLLAACGVLLAIAAALSVIGSRPVSSDGAAAAEDLAGAAPPPVGPELGPFGQYRVVDDRPLFSENRRPVIEPLAAEAEETPPPSAQQAAEPPKVNLTGVVITPQLRLATLTPAGGGEAIVLREGKAMEGENQGWTLVDIRPRRVELEAAGGRKVQLDLVVHDQKIKEPPKPVVAREPDRAAEEGDPEETMSRAEEIRQRIAERREQLRQQAVEGRALEEEPPKNDYQAAIQRMLQQGSGRSDDDEDGGE